MFGYISKNKVTKTINIILDDLREAEFRVVMMDQEDIMKDFEDYKRSWNEIQGGKRVLNILLKYFK